MDYSVLFHLLNTELCVNKSTSKNKEDNDDKKNSAGSFMVGVCKLNSCVFNMHAWLLLRSQISSTNHTKTATICERRAWLNFHTCIVLSSDILENAEVKCLVAMYGQY